MSELNPTGSALVYSTYLGGSNTNYGAGITVDASGDAYAAGFTKSTDFPTTPGAFQTTLRGVGNCFVTELNPTGTALVYSTYLGGSGGDQANSVAVDISGNAYLTGRTQSTDFPTTPGAFQTTGPPRSSIAYAFVTKLNPTGSALMYSSYLGGSSSGWGYGIAVDMLGDAYVTGYTSEAEFPTTPGAFQTTCKDGNGCAFFTEVNASGSSLLYSTYLGGSGSDATIGHGIAVDTLGDAYVTGGTSSPYFPTTSGAFQTTCGGGCAFVSKFGPLVYVTPISLNFGNQTVGISSPPQTATLTNLINATLTITSIGVTGTNSGDFAESNTCGNSLAPRASCTISVTFTPTTTGSRTAAVTITDGAPNSPQTVSLSGIGVLPAVTLSPTDLTFPTQVVFPTSKAKTVTLKNTGAGILTISSFAVTGPFHQTHTCASSVAPGASCTISVTFAPTTKGTATGYLAITDNAPGSPEKVTLAGTGTFIQPSPTSLSFGNQPGGYQESSGEDHYEQQRRPRGEHREHFDHRNRFQRLCSGKHLRQDPSIRREVLHHGYLQAFSRG